MSIRMKIMIVSHQILSKEDTGVESVSDLGIDLLGVVHQLLELF